MNKNLKTLYTVSLAAIMMTLNACNEDININPNESSVINSNQNSFDIEKNIIEGSYIVFYNSEYIAKSSTFNSSKNYSERSEFIRTTTNQLAKDLKFSENNILNVYSQVTFGFSVLLNTSELNLLKNDSRVARIEQDYYGVLGAKQNGRGGNNNPPASQTMPWGINRVGGSHDGTGKTAWIIDSGIDLDHPDLNIDIARSRTFIPTGKDSNSPDDNAGHGSHVAGIIAGLDNDIGIVGIAANATLVAVKVCNSKGNCALSDILAGIDYVASQAQPGDVVNMSFATAPSDDLDNAVITMAAQGVFCAVGSGDAVSPGRINAPNVFSTSAIDSLDNWNGFGAGQNADYAAPGVSIYSTYKGGNYITYSGTSMAIPHVAGVLLMTNGMPNMDGYNINDPDNADPIIHF